MIDAVEIQKKDVASYREIHDRMWSLEKKNIEVTPIGSANSYEVHRDSRLKLIESLIMEKERFNHVFKTANGSVYFVFFDGKSTRFYYRERTKMVELDSDIVEHLYFVTEETRDFLRNRGYGADGYGYVNNFRDFLDVEITVHDLAVGLVPFQFGRIRPYPEIKVEEKNGILIIKGDVRGDFTSGHHFGHKIVEVLK